ncbi:MAG: glycosyltransferase family 4 protein [Candidatus Bathyarchaeota archaeon]|nr:glycosyltransferase family 4 protein [Candidatus Bathyarchaeota archaeon]
MFPKSKSALPTPVSPMTRAATLSCWRKPKTADNLTVMMLSWEFPPRVIGGISPHVYFLARDLVKQGINVHVVTCDFPNASTDEVMDGIEVHRIYSYRNPSPDFASWVYLMNVNMQKDAARLVRELGGKIDVFHAHDWLVADAAVGLKHVFRKPLLVTMHSTEIGRRESLHTTTENMIHETENWLTYEAWRVICCSHYMISHVKWAFSLPDNKMVMIPNGVYAKTYEDLKVEEEFRSNFALPEEKIVLFVGRLVYEKGIHVLVNAMPQVLSQVNAKFIIVGSGYMKEQLQSIVHGLGLDHKVFFEGFMDENSLLKLQKIADVTVVPSLFEPFGIVALEAMAAGSPVVVSDTGGMSEIVEHDVSGVKVYPNDASSLAWGINRVLLDEGYRGRLRQEAYRVVTERYGWDRIAQQTKRAYHEVMEEYARSGWSPTKSQRI